MKIFIARGHNNAFNFIRDEHGRWRLSLFRDQGAGSGENTEFQFTSKIVREIDKKFPKIQMMEFEFVPEKLNIGDRIKWINDRAKPTDIALELHMDSFSTPDANGTSLWYAGRDLKNMGEKFLTEYIRITGLRNRGVMPDTLNRLRSLAFCRQVKCKSFLFEMGFITNTRDRDLVWTKGAQGLVSAVSIII